MKIWHNCFPRGAGQQIFKVKGITWDYIVNILKRECSCRRWQLTGIPCHHSVSCFRHERISPESMVHTCYSLTAFKNAYCEIIMPCRDQREWEKTNGCLVQPPVYTKHVGRPATKRKKAPEEKNGKLTRDGTIQHCSVCFSTQHNKRKCPDLGRDGGAQGLSHPRAEGATQGHAKTAAKKKMPLRKNRTSSQGFGSSVDDPAQSSQTSMLELLMQTATPTQQSHVVPGPLPESSFIANSRDAMPLPRARTTTAIAARKMKKSMGPKKKK